MFIKTPFKTHKNSKELCNKMQFFSVFPGKTKKLLIYGEKMLIAAKRKVCVT